LWRRALALRLFAGLKAYATKRELKTVQAYIPRMRVTVATRPMATM